jgi:hypothetical protein
VADDRCSGGGWRGTGRIPVLVAGLERALTWAGEPWKYANRRGTLDTVRVNGPEDGLEWDVVDWHAHEQNVAGLRRRIFQATRNQDWARVRSLQKLMLGSWSNTLLCVRQETQRNTGRRTAGIDGEKALSNPGMGGLLPGEWYPAKSLRRWIIICGG